MANGYRLLTNEEKRIARACGISANDIVFCGFNGCGKVYRLVNKYMYISGTFDGYEKPYIYRALLRQFIERAKRACGY